MHIQGCLNGSRKQGEHPRLPLTPAELAEAAKLAVEAGADIFHIHVRDEQGQQSLAAEDCNNALTAMREACPGKAIGVSTAAWIEPDSVKRLRLIEGWTVLPDYASVNFSEEGVEDLCTLMLVKGVGIEAGLSSVEDAQLLVRLGIGERCLRLLIEPDEQNIDEAWAIAQQIEYTLGDAGIQTPRLLHGFERTAWPLLTIALERGYDVRIGFEDTLTLPDGQEAEDNANLVKVVHDLLPQKDK
jgi:uncharacterized protein (DUF849 family)